MEPHEFWQEIHPAGSFATESEEGFSDFYPATLPDGRQLLLPIRVLPGDGMSAVASLIVNQASFAVEDALVDAMTVQSRVFRPEIVVGVPTLGLPLAYGIARCLGHDRMVALGTSRKFWYFDGLSEPISSITSPSHGKRLYLDPRLLPLLTGKRVLLVDDVLSTGASMAAVLRLLAKIDVAPVALATAMHQSMRWKAALAEFDPSLAEHAIAPLSSPLLRKTEAGRWVRA